ncbi:hypothetical protein SPBR_08665 [Sporothrix brasiliensis 5110]|uniref:Centromere protein H C-terminal domain-containing protein n=1 Tax=Sporothrix brasiliensis 5110 TaxID=1398154 RepID=A0A0C2IMR9_9PEZI|nr:uncharacterized protein SPBR_08665 [Sporothrix brasiliensis 5110]KIH86282.1 hypothetical protein SPBR_08665 [Sporothrix brasiliensis 5110]
MSDAPDEGVVGPLDLSEDEKRALALYDQLRSIRLEIGLLKARESFTGVVGEGDIAARQRQLLEARASYVLRNEVVDSVLTVNAVLKAVHGATQASPIERDLLPAIKQRDAASKAVAQESSARREAHDESATVAAELRQLEKQNARLAAEVRELALAIAATDQLGPATAGDEGDMDEAILERKKLLSGVKTSRQRWTLIKGAASAIIVGSGVDWTKEVALSDIVLDSE